MAELQSYLSFLAGPLFLLGFARYGQAIWREETKPAKASWVIWWSVDTIVLAGMIAAGSVNAQIIGAVLGSGVIAILALIYGTPGWTKLDVFCLVGAVLGIALWMGTNNPVLGIVICSGVIFLGSIPTFISAWEDPCREDRIAWTIYWLSCVFAVVGVSAWTLADATQPLTFFAIESIVMALIFIPRKTMPA